MLYIYIYIYQSIFYFTYLCIYNTLTHTHTRTHIYICINYFDSNEILSYCSKLSNIICFSLSVAKINCTRLLGRYLWNYVLQN